MRKIFLFISLIFSGTLISQTLSPVAQALYTEMFNINLTHGNFAITNGATIHSSPDSSVFYLQWFPNSSTQPDTLPLIVSLHGSGGNVFNDFYIWQPYAAANNCGVVCVQYYRGTTAIPPDDYSVDSIIYNTIELALSSISYPSGKALLHGFSRGSARSYAVNLYDALSGNNYFCTTISNAGAYQSGYPIYMDIDNNVYGPTPFIGKRWALYCGALDTAYAQSGCGGMSNTQTWLNSKGATVDVFIQDPTGTHGGFHLNPNNVDSILVYYLQCFNSTVGIDDESSDMISVYPNPSNGTVFVKTPTSILNENCWIEIYDGIGRLAYKKPLMESIVYLHEIRSGNYAYVVFTNGVPIKKGKMLVQ